MRKIEDGITYYVIKKKKDIPVDGLGLGKPETRQALYVLQQILEYFQIPNQKIFRTSLGKPFFKNQNIYFNYSYTKQYMAIAISNQDVGIDIEEKDRNVNQVMIKRCNFNQNHALRDFVVRESYCKLSGKGITIFFQTTYNKKYSNTLIDTQGYICSIWSKGQEQTFLRLNV